MSHSTHVGFNEPLTTLTPCDCKPALRLAVGVRSDWLIARPNSFPDGPLLLPSLENPWGVGHIRAIDSNDAPD